MTQQLINVGASANDGQGDPIRTAFIKCNNNFSQLFNQSTLSSIENGQSKVVIPFANSNVFVSVAGSANVLQVTPIGTLVVGVVSATGNVTGNYILGNGALLSGLPATYSNANVAGFLPTYTGNIGAVNISATGNVTGNTMSVAGNVTGGFFYGNGAGLTGVIAVANVGAANLIANGTSSFDIPVANGNIVGNINGNSLVFVFSEFGANVAGYVNATGNVTGNNLSATQASVAGNVTGGNLFTGGVISAAGNIVTSGNIAGNLTGNLVTNQISSSSNLSLSATGAVRITGGMFRLPSFTTAQLANITGVPGDLVYNTTVNKVQAWQYDATSTFTWVSLAVSTYQ